MHGHVHLSCSPSPFPLLPSHNFSTQFIQLWQRRRGLKNTLIPPLAETEQRTDTFSAHKEGGQVSTTLMRHPRTHPAIPNPSESQAAMLLLPQADCSAVPPPAPHPQRGSYTKPLCFLPQNPTVLASPAGASPESWDVNTAQQSTRRGRAPPGAPGQGRGGGRGGGSVHAAGAKLNMDPYFCPNVLFSFCFNHLSPKTSSDEALLRQVAGKRQLRYQPSPVPV